MEVAELGSDVLLGRGRSFSVWSRRCTPRQELQRVEQEVYPEAGASACGAGGVPRGRSFSVWSRRCTPRQELQRVEQEVYPEESGSC
ncbi:unnamed protein product [Arctogadus glacialis]